MPRRPLLGNDIASREKKLSPQSIFCEIFHYFVPTVEPHFTLFSLSFLSTLYASSSSALYNSSELLYSLRSHKPRRLISVRNFNSSFPFFLLPPHYATLHKTTWRNYTNTDKCLLIPSRNEQMALLQNTTSLTPTLKNMRNSTRNQ